MRCMPREGRDQRQGNNCPTTVVVVDREQKRGQDRDARRVIFLRALVRHSVKNLICQKYDSIVSCTKKKTFSCANLGMGGGRQARRGPHLPSNTSCALLAPCSRGFVCTHAGVCVCVGASLLLPVVPLQHDGEVTDKNNRQRRSQFVFYRALRWSSTNFARPGSSNFCALTQPRARG